MRIILEFNNFIPSEINSLCGWVTEWMWELEHEMDESEAAVQLSFEYLHRQLTEVRF